MSIFGKGKKPQSENVAPKNEEPLVPPEQADVVSEDTVDTDGVDTSSPVRADATDAVELITDDDIGDTSVADEAQDDAEHAAGCGEESEEGSEGEATESAGSDAGKMDRMRELAKFSVDSNFLKTAWRATSLGRIALMCVGVFVVVVASAYFFVLQPINTQMHEIRTQKNLLHDYVVIQQAGATIGGFKDGLMTGDQRLTVMSEVKLMAEGAGVRIMGDPELLLQRPLVGDFIDYPVRLRLRGEYHEIGEFLALLECSPRFIVVESVEITSDVASSSKDCDSVVVLALAAWEG